MNRRRAVARTVTTVIVACLAVGAGAIPPAPANAASKPRSDRAPNQYEYSLLALANMSRANPASNAEGERPGPETVVPPLRWNHDLAEAARVHTEDMIASHCYQHDSCQAQGGVWWKRIEQYYGAWTGLAENIIAIGDARSQHRGWMRSSGHRKNILGGGLVDFGAGVDVDPAQNNLEYGTEDFGVYARPSLRSLPVVPAAAVLDPYQLNKPTWDYEFIVNYYDYDKRPATAVAVVDGTRRVLTDSVGAVGNQTFKGLSPVPRDTTICKHVYFELTRTGDSTVYRWPTTGSIPFGARDGSCWDPYAPMPNAIPIPPVISPTVVIDSPATGTLTGIVEISAHATDDGTVKNMEVWIDGKRVRRVARPSVVKRWNMAPKAVIPGTHTIVVKAFDNEGNVGTASVVVTK